jgi:hypothetical protein
VSARGWGCGATKLDISLERLAEMNCLAFQQIQKYENATNRVSRTAGG